MAFKDILVHVNGAAHCAERVKVATELAARWGAHLVGLYVRSQPYLPTYARAELGPQIADLQARWQREAAERAEAAFMQQLRPTAVNYEWRVVDGEISEALALNARYADLTVVGQHAPDEEDPGVADALVLEAGRPVLVVPYAGRFPVLGERIMVAWNASREATRAVADALPLLTRAKHVDVLVANPTGGPNGHGDVPGADIGLHLARHGVKAEAQYIRSNDMDIGNLLLSRAADLQSDLIVMGAYGRSRLRELILGGATRHLLEHMTVPVLMSH